MVVPLGTTPGYIPGSMPDDGKVLVRSIIPNLKGLMLEGTTENSESRGHEMYEVPVP